MAEFVYNLDPRKKQDKKLSKEWTPQSHCVEAIVILFENFFPQIQIMFIVCWSSNAYSCYLRNLPELAQQQNYVSNKKQQHLILTPFVN